VKDQHGVTSSLEVAFGNRISQAFRDEQQQSISAKQEHKKRKKDMPKRPLSAYNLFFKDERKRILRDTASPPSEEEQEEELLDSYGNVVMVSVKKRKRRPPRRDRKLPHYKIDFKTLAQKIAKRWKELTAVELGPYQADANTDKERYTREMAVYKAKKAAQASAEASAT
jgi:hypothetical protein